MSSELDVHAVTLVFVGASVLASAALFARQSLIVAYIVLGALLGPWGFALVGNSETIREIGHVGIIFLLFLLGLNMHPQKLVKLLAEATAVTCLSGAVFVLVGASIAFAFGYGVLESLLVGVAMIFSSTIVGLKLLPTTALHHRHTGEVIISVLLLQDIIAIVVLLLMQGFATPGSTWAAMLPLLVYLPLFIVLAFAAERYVLIPLMSRFDTIQEYVFVTAIGWCLGLATIAEVAGLSYEIGAFIAGVALAANPISRYIAESLKPLRDFFLVMFFFSLGASFDLGTLPQVLLPAAVMAAALLLIKPWVFKRLLMRSDESPALATEVGMRLGQCSEFALMIAVLAAGAGVISPLASYLIQACTLFTIVISAYLVMLRYPTPIGVSSKLRST
jgi:Kef-type K+ transport system membrane component KefB